MGIFKKSLSFNKFAVFLYEKVKNCRMTVEMARVNMIYLIK